MFFLLVEAHKLKHNDAPGAVQRLTAFHIVSQRNYTAVMALLIHLAQFCGNASIEFLHGKEILRVARFLEAIKIWSFQGKFQFQFQFLAALQKVED
jgi:hypothetical protein